jgi:hypothetical protein
MRGRLLPIFRLAAAGCGSAPDAPMPNAPAPGDSAQDARRLDDPKPHRPEPPVPVPQDPAQCGYARARHDIAAGHVRLLMVGVPSEGNSGLDPETGLVRVGEGCVTTDDADVARDAYNAEMRRAAAAGEVDRFVFLDRVRTREQVMAALGGTARVEEGSNLSLLDGRYRAELGTWYQPPGRNAVGQRHLRVYEGASATPRIEMNTNDAVSVALDPDGQTLVVGDGTGVRTFDLATGTFLQIFYLPR